MPGDFKSENIPEQNQLIDMNAFRAEVRMMIHERKLDIKVEEVVQLTEEDAKMFYLVENYKSGSVPKSVIMQYRGDLQRSRNPIRVAFSSVIANRLQTLILNDLDSARR